MAQMAIIETRLSFKLRQLQRQLDQWEKEFLLMTVKQPIESTREAFGRPNKVFEGHFENLQANIIWN